MSLGVQFLALLSLAGVVDVTSAFAIGNIPGFKVRSTLDVPGRHRFTARVSDRSGHKATETVTTRVLPAPAPLATLAGAWSRTVTPKDKPGLIVVFAPITMAPKGVSRFGAHGFACCDCREDRPLGVLPLVGLRQRANAEGAPRRLLQQVSHLGRRLDETTRRMR